MGKIGNIWNVWQYFCRNLDFLTNEKNIIGGKIIYSLVMDFVYLCRQLDTKSPSGCSGCSGGGSTGDKLRLQSTAIRPHDVRP